MSKNEPDLDQLLSDMAENVPPMPADFHEQWINAVRAEAKHTEEPVQASVPQWPRIISIAAVFIFLIGGTFIYRSTRKTILTESRPVNAVSVPEAAVMEESDMEAAIPEDTDMINDTGDMVFESAGFAGDADYSGAAAPDAEADAGKTGKAAEEVSAAGALMMDMAEETAKDKTAAEVPATGAPVTIAPTPTAGASVAETPETVPAERQGISGFFADMGDFLLTVWPYLLITAVPLIVAAGIKKFKKKK